MKTTNNTQATALIWTNKKAMDNGICSLSFGAGQDSTTILYELIYNPIFRIEKLKGRSLIVIFCDTGNERREVYSHLWSVKTLCESFGIKFVHLAGKYKSKKTKYSTIEMHKRKGRDTDHIITDFHTEASSSLQAKYETNDSLMMRNNPSCTSNLKILPFYRFMNSLCAELLGKEKVRDYGKKDLVEFAEKTQAIEVMIGFAVGEEKRMEGAQAPQKSKWWESVEKTFPLITELKLDRNACIDFMDSTPHGACGPSMCKMCPNITKQTLVLMWRIKERRSDLIDWVRFEKRKLRTWAPIQAEKEEANNGAFGRKLDLFGELREALEKFSDWSDEELLEHEFRNGHCISASY